MVDIGFERTSMERSSRHLPFWSSRMRSLLRLNFAVVMLWTCSLGGWACAQEPIAEAVPVDSKPADGPKTMAARPLTVSVELSSQAVIAGTLVETESIQMKTSFGEATIPLSEIAGIRLATPQDTTTTVVMLNGDSITGAVDIKSVMVETEWGSAKINGSAILSIMLVPELKWVNSTSLNGRRWFLVDAKEAAAAAQRMANPSNSNPNNPTSNPNSGPFPSAGNRGAVPTNPLPVPPPKK